MGPDDIAFLKVVVAGVFWAGTGLTWYALRLRYRSRQLPPLDRETLAAREEEAQQRSLMEARLAEMEERLDFFERRLTQTQSDPSRIEARIPTPV